ncbi:hypothetical protein Dsin_011700 [Dipteronia sinensis]|uniref:Reverse transcriptase domain-containing protein n=1 Tax=Dipteronia sinensis TaxID=43782 RepID=A0AAE0AHA6_9ROSI|nr:hypothetical protein Dsin_011700 [Dipteronia sinensis]
MSTLLMLKGKERIFGIFSLIVNALFPSLNASGETLTVPWIHLREEVLRNKRLKLLADLWKGPRLEEQLWRQKWRVSWLKEGDKNTKIFHLTANGRKRGKFISDIYLDGVKCSEPSLVRKRVFYFFSNHYKNVCWERFKIRGLGVQHLSLTSSKALGIQFSEEEVWTAFSECDGNKASGPGYFNLNFVKAYWGLIKKDFMAFTSGFHNDGFIISDLNNTFIALIPKRVNPGNIRDYMPINLVGSIYKIMAKVLENRLKKLLILVNGNPTGEFEIQRGLHQGDSLSHFLFNLVTEGLNCLFKRAYELNMIKGITFCEDAVHISHLQFADDTILFLEPREEFMSNAKRILRCFELASGLKINFHKSCVVRIRFPLGARPSSMGFWKPVLQRIENRLASWKTGFLSKRGRLTLIKSVILSIPTYFMSLFKIPGDSVIKKKIHFVDWTSVYYRKSLGGLRIGRISHKNISLLAKWVWRFGFEFPPLWKRVICAKYGLDSKLLVWNWNCSAKASNFVKAIGSLFSANSISAKILDVGLKIVMGNGATTKFWVDVKSEYRCLKEVFPLIFTLDCRKEGPVSEFGKWNGDLWIWQFKSVESSVLCVVWSSWAARNQMVFNGKVLSLDHFVDTVKFRATWWFEHLEKGCIEPITHLLLDLKERSVDLGIVKKRKTEA